LAKTGLFLYVLARPAGSKLLWPALLDKMPS